MDFLFWMKKAVINMFKGVPQAPGDLMISEKMANAITAWMLAFYQQPAWLEHGVRISNLPITITEYMATLACNEITIDAGPSARGKWITDQLNRFFVPHLNNTVQLAGAGGRAIVKPYVDGRNILCDIVPADRIYPTRINGAGMTTAGFFTDFSVLHGRKVVRVEGFDLQPDGLHLTNRAYYYGLDENLAGEIPLTDVPEWAGLEPEITISGVDRPLFAEIKMPFANTVDETSSLPVSLYARALDTICELDRIYSEFLYEVHSGKRKRIVDRDAIRPDERGCGIPFRDQVTDLYLTMDIDGTNMKPFEDYTPDIRVDEYQKALDIQCRMLESQTGFSQGTFNFDIKQGRMTATQVISDDRNTYNTIHAIQDRGIKQGLKDLIYCYDVYATLYGLAPAGAVDEAVTFGDSIFEDTATEFARQKMLVDAGYLKPEKLIGWYFGVDDAGAVEYMPAQASRDPFGFGGGAQ